MTDDKYGGPWAASFKEQWHEVMPRTPKDLRPPLDKNGIEIKVNQTVRLCRTHDDYINIKHATITIGKNAQLMVGDIPLQELATGSALNHHMVEIIAHEPLKEAVAWDKEKLLKLVIEYNKKRKTTEPFTLTIDGKDHQFIPGYARYLIEHLCSELGYNFAIDGTQWIKFSVREP